MSCDYAEIKPNTNDTCNIAARISAAAIQTDLDDLWKTIDSSHGRVDITCRVKASVEKIKRCTRVVRIDGESSQLGTLRIFPQTQCSVGLANLGRGYGVARIQPLRPLQIRKRALPFPPPAVDVRTILSGQSIVRLQLQRAVELRQRVLVLAMTPVKE